MFAQCLVANPQIRASRGEAQLQSDVEVLQIKLNMRHLSVFS